jgi:hypothetical protein
VGQARSAIEKCRAAECALTQTIAPPKAYGDHKRTRYAPGKEPKGGSWRCAATQCCAKVVSEFVIAQFVVAQRALRCKDSIVRSGDRPFNGTLRLETKKLQRTKLCVKNAPRSQNCAKRRENNATHSLPRARRTRTDVMWAMGGAGGFGDLRPGSRQLHASRMRHVPPTAHGLACVCAVVRAHGLACASCAPAP